MPWRRGAAPPPRSSRASAGPLTSSRSPGRCRPGSFPSPGPPSDRSITRAHALPGGLRYVNCGHLSALLLRRDGTLDRLEPTSTVLGLFRQWECSVGECRLEPDDLLALYTDGVTEAFDDTGEEFGEQRLVDALRRHRDRPPDALLTSIVSEVRSFSPHEQHDDLTLIVARRRSASRIQRVT